MRHVTCQSILIDNVCALDHLLICTGSCDSYSIIFCTLLFYPNMSSDLCTQQCEFVITCIIKCGMKLQTLKFGNRYKLILDFIMGVITYQSLMLRSNLSHVSKNVNHQMKSHITSEIETYGNFLKLQYFSVFCSDIACAIKCLVQWMMLNLILFNTMNGVNVTMQQISLRGFTWTLHLINRLLKMSNQREFDLYQVWNMCTDMTDIWAHYINAI